MPTNEGTKTPGRVLATYDATSRAAPSFRYRVLFGGLNNWIGCSAITPGDVSLGSALYREGDASNWARKIPGIKTATPWVFTRGFKKVSEDNDAFLWKWWEEHGNHLNDGLPDGAQEDGLRYDVQVIPCNRLDKDEIGKIRLYSCFIVNVALSELSGLSEEPFVASFSLEPEAVERIWTTV